VKEKFGELDIKDQKFMESSETKVSWRKLIVDHCINSESDEKY